VAALLLRPVPAETESFVPMPQASPRTRSRRRLGTRGAHRAGRPGQRRSGRGRSTMRPSRRMSGPRASAWPTPCSSGGGVDRERAVPGVSIFTSGPCRGPSSASRRGCRPSPVRPDVGDLDVEGHVAAAPHSSAKRPWANTAFASKRACRSPTPQARRCRGLPANSAVSVALAGARAPRAQPPGLGAGGRRLASVALRAVRRLAVLEEIG
jgi:hypothetical protein